jgi:hypothetical protein
MQQTHEIFKIDKWNMMKVERQGTRFIVRDISTEWGEECHTFVSRHEVLHYAEQRFAADRCEFEEVERLRILTLFKEICQ